MTALARLPFTTSLPALTVVSAGEGIGAAERQHAVADLGQAARAADRAGKGRAGVVAADGQRARAERDGARAGERADRLVEAVEGQRAPLATEKALDGAKTFTAPACSVPTLTLVAPV